MFFFKNSFKKEKSFASTTKQPLKKVNFRNHCSVSSNGKDILLNSTNSDEIDLISRLYIPKHFIKDDIFFALYYAIQSFIYATGPAQLFKPRLAQSWLTPYVLLRVNPGLALIGL